MYEHQIRRLSVVDLARFIGCGLCVPTGLEDAIYLEKKLQER